MSSTISNLKSYVTHYEFFIIARIIQEQMFPTFVLVVQRRGFSKSIHGYPALTYFSFEEIIENKMIITSHNRC